MRPKCARLVCFLVTTILFVGGASFELAYSNEQKNPEEAIQLLLNRKPKILLQWTPHISQKIKLAVRGGCSKASGDYNWLSSNMSILVVSSFGVIHAKRPGIATVKVVSTCDPHNFDEIVVKVFPSQDVYYDMDEMDSKLENDLSEPIYVAKPNPEWKACLNMTVLVYTFVGGTLGIVCAECCHRFGSGMPITRCSEKHFKGRSMRRIRRYRRWL